ncbi:chromosomal replication initiator DnaA [Phaeovulum sp.]|uniref:chromosomal replication initiator DnaA n=1 Tax=Phaeovulum sp. TaxID=2934796 RepID=UPI003567DD66
MARQMAFDLPLRAARGRADFFISPANAQALAAIDAPEAWPQGRLLLRGPEGAGKSHLAGLWAEEQGAPTVSAAMLQRANVPALVAAGAVLVEDADTIGGHPEAEAALFHLHNLAAAEGALLLLTATRPPRDWGLTLPDLASRMTALPIAQIEPPDDALLAAVLVKLFADRQVTVSPALITWLVAHIDRSLAEARQVVDRLDATALSLGVPINRRLAQQVLDTGT